MVDSFSEYFITALYILAVLKLLRINSLAKIGAAALLSFLLFFGITLMAGATLLSPLILFNFSNEVLGAFAKTIFPLVAAAILYFNRRAIVRGTRDFFHELKEDKKNNGENLSEILGANNLEDSSRKYFKLIMRDIEHQVIYIFGFFALLQSMLYFIYAYDYIPLVGQLNKYNIYSFSKAHLLWLIPLTFILAYIYSRFYYEIIADSVFQKFLAICRFGEHQKAQVAAGEDLLWSNAAQSLGVIENNLISDYYEIAPGIIFIEANNKIYFLMGANKCYRDFRAAFNYIKSIGPGVFSKNYYREFK